MRTTKISRVMVGLAGGAACAALMLAVAAPRARACGGFFCNQPTFPTDVPVAQTAENVLFAMERTSTGQFQLEAHVQIFYTGPADRFSWVVPVDSMPTVGVGSNAVFTALLQQTTPRFQLNWVDVGVCKPSMYPPPLPGGGVGGTGGSGGGFAADAAAGPGVSVTFRGDVGPYDAAVIKSTSTTDAGPLLDWLAENKYFVTDQGKRLIEDYVREDKFFVAIRLQNDKGVGEIAPLTMTFLGPGPCVPLKLTAVAAIRDLKVNLWVLAQNRVVPDNFFELELNQARIDWFKGGANYEDLVKVAADQANGNAFITDYAGPASVLKGMLYRPGMYNLDAIRATRIPPDALDRIAAMGFPRDSSLITVLRVHIPMPAPIAAMGIDERTFYNQLRSYWFQFQADFKPFDATALAADLDAKFVTPLRKTQELFDRHAKLTRLSTFISPEEMTVDPTFVMNPSLPDVPVVRQATASRMCGDRQYDSCSAPVRLEVPSGEAVWFLPEVQPVCYGQPFSYQRASLDKDMPALYRAYDRDGAGEGATRFDNRDIIRMAITTHNEAVAKTGVPIPPGTGGAGGSTGGTGGQSTGGRGGTGASGGRGGTQPMPMPDGEGCSCALPGTPASTSAPVLAGPLLVGLAALLRRRRRR
jgi:MYXO-CTERM domain-containing protein